MCNHSKSEKYTKYNIFILHCFFVYFYLLLKSLQYISRKIQKLNRIVLKTHRIQNVDNVVSPLAYHDIDYLQTVLAHSEAFV